MSFSEMMSFWNYSIRQLNCHFYAYISASSFIACWNMQLLQTVVFIRVPVEGTVVCFTILAQIVAKQTLNSVLKMLSSTCNHLHSSDNLHTMENTVLA